MPGRCGYAWPGRGGSPGCCGRTGCDGSGRGPPITGCCGRDPGYAGRGGPAGRGPPGGAGRAPGAPVCACAPAPPAATGRGGAGGRSPLGPCRVAGRGSGDVGNGGDGAVGRCSSIRRRSVGGTMRPAVGGFGGGGGLGR